MCYVTCQWSLFPTPAVKSVCVILFCFNMSPFPPSLDSRCFFSFIGSVIFVIVFTFILFGIWPWICLFFYLLLYFLFYVPFINNCAKVRSGEAWVSLGMAAEGHGVVARIFLSECMLNVSQRWSKNCSDRFFACTLMAYLPPLKFSFILIDFVLQIVRACDHSCQVMWTC